MRSRSISIHALREEGDLSSSVSLCRASNFYPRPPRGGRPVARICSPVVIGISIHALREEGDFPEPRRGYRQRYFYPRPPRGGRHTTLLEAPQRPSISIHALREEGDQGLWPRRPAGRPISIHALREEGDSMSSFGLPLIALFLSTPSARRATEVCGADRRICEISIHALREEGDTHGIG